MKGSATDAPIVRDRGDTELLHGRGEYEEGSFIRGVDCEVRSILLRDESGKLQAFQAAEEAEEGLGSIRRYLGSRVAIA